MLDPVPPDSHSNLVPLLRTLPMVDQTRARVLLDVLEVRPAQDRWAAYWLTQCELLSTAFLLNAEVLDRAEAFCCGDTLSAFVRANSAELARACGHDEKSAANLMVACHAIVPALFMGELAAQSWERTIGAIAEGQTVHARHAGSIDCGLHGRANMLRNKVMSLLGYDEALAEEVATRSAMRAFRHDHRDDGTPWPGVLKGVL